MGGRKHVGDAHVQCSECAGVIPLPVYAEVVPSAIGTSGQDLLTSSDTAPLWAHYETHAFGSLDE
jgi:hypothetical protein